MTRVAELLRHDHVERLFKIAIVEDQHRRVAAQFHRDTLHAVGCEFHQMLADRHRSGETDFANDRRVNQVAADGIGHAEHHLAHAVGQAGVN